MKILHVISDLSIGGAETMLVSIVKEMSKYDNVHVEVVTLYEGTSHLYLELLKVNVTLTCLSMKRGYPSIKAIFKLAKIMNGFDIVHSHLFPSNYLVSVSSILSKCNNIITTEHNTFNNRRKITILKYIEKIIYRKYFRIIAISDATKASLANWLGSYENIVTIENGVDKEKFLSVSESFKKNTEDYFVIIAIGSFSAQKDQATIIRALKRLPQNVVLQLVGDGVRRDELQKLVCTLGLNERVNFLGLRSDIPELICSSDVLVQSSNWEGFGLTAVEGMLCGKPVIVSDVPGLREVVAEFGLTFAKSSDEQLSKYIEQLLTDAETYNKFSKLSLERSKYYSIERLCKQYMDIYRLS